MAHAGGAAAAAAVGDDGKEFWTACPHCCHVHLYPRAYLGLRLRCPTPACRRAFPASELPAAPPIVPGADMYFCTWAFFPLGPPATAEGWVPFTPFHPFSPAPSPSPAPNPAAAASADTPSRPMSRKKVGVCLKGRARAEAEEEEEEAAAAAINLEAKAGGLAERDGSVIDIDINETVDLSELGFRVDEMGVLQDLL
ncbi:hypothetical protein HU200_023632 [Digitaria exilis]|uniref:Uncharacterized protein n=1 Tax=Digitaria exilis TaxID=1010633 RepID=A0A835C5P6_9POAL|nr:hypothetical protein HU200_023632 [Digitaria exilis]